MSVLLVRTASDTYTVNSQKLTVLEAFFYRLKYVIAPSQLILSFLQVLNGFSLYTVTELDLWKPILKRANEHQHWLEWPNWLFVRKGKNTFAEIITLQDGAYYRLVVRYLIQSGVSNY